MPGIVSQPNDSTEESLRKVVTLLATGSGGSGNTENLIHTTQVGPNTDKVVTFNQSGENGNVNSEISAWGFAVAENNSEAYLEPNGLAVEGSGKSILIEADKITFNGSSTVQIGGNINTSGGAEGHGGSINTSVGQGAWGGNINTSDSGGSINTSVNGGGLSLDNYGGNITSHGVDTDKRGGSITLNSTNEASPWRSSGSINLSASWYGDGGSIISTGGGEDIGGNIAGGTLNMSGGGSGAGGSINTSNGGGAIDTCGTGSIQLGVTGTRTTLNGSASGGNKTITLPNLTGALPIALISVSTSLDFGAITAGDFADLTISLIGAATTDVAFVTCLSSRGTTFGKLMFEAFVGSANNVTIRAHNPTSGSLNPDAYNFKVCVIKTS